MIYEYKWVTNYKPDSSLLNQYGRQGWRVVPITALEHYILMERQVGTNAPVTD